MVAGTPQHASYIWALFYLLALKMLEAMTVDVLMGTMLPPSRYAIKVLGKASGSIVRFEEKFRFCLTLALTKVLVSGKGEFPAMDDWDFGPEEAKITSKSNPFCRWIWAELSRLVSSDLLHHLLVTKNAQGQEFLIHLRFKLRMFGKDVIEDFPPMLGPNNIPATSAVRAKYDLIRATEDLGLNLQRFFDIPPANFLQDPRALQARNGVTQPSISMIMSDALLNLTKALIKIVGDDQAAFALWLRSGRKSCAMSHKIFVLPAVFVSFLKIYQFLPPMCNQLICLLAACSQDGGAQTCIWLSGGGFLRHPRRFYGALRGRREVYGNIWQDYRGGYAGWRIRSSN